MASPALAQGTAPEQILLDRDSELVGQVTVDGQSYEIYRIKNTLWYASGVEIYKNGDKVTSEREASGVFQAYAERQALDSLDDADLDTLRELEAMLGGTQNATTSAVDEVDATILLLDGLKNETIEANRTAWDVAVNETPALEEFNSTRTPEFQEAVREWHTARDRLHTNVTRLVELLEQQEAGESVEPSTLYQQYVTTIEAIDSFNSQSSQLTDSLSAMVATTQGISTSIYGLPDSGPDLALHFVKLSHELDSSSAHIEEITTPISEHAGRFDNPARAVRSTERNLMDDWENRRDAASKVNQSLIVAALAILGMIGIYYWRNR